MKKIPNAVYHQTTGMAKWNANPMIMALGHYRTPDELRRDLTYVPYMTDPIGDIPDHLREARIDEARRTGFVVTANVLEIAVAAQRLLWNNYLPRNPGDPRVIEVMDRMASVDDSHDTDVIWFGTMADAMVVRAITGNGKTTILSKILDLWPPAICHHAHPGMPWVRQIQITYLYVDMSHDGSLSGLLLQIIMAIDKTLGTDHAYTIPSSVKTISKLQRHVIRLLASFFCGVVVIDEIQSLILREGPDVASTANFMMRMTNAGIPIIFAGNPLGFEKMFTWSQFASRAMASGNFVLDPFAADDRQWTHLFAPAIWRMQVMKEVAPLEGELLAEFTRCSGGIPRYACKARDDAQLMAIAAGENKVTVEHLRQAYEFKLIGEDKALVDGFAMKDATQFLGLKDVPLLYYAKKWGQTKEVLALMLTDTLGYVPTVTKAKEKELADAVTIAPGENPERAQQRIENEIKAFKAQKTRGKTTAARKAAAKAMLSPEDLRAAGLAGSLVQKFNQLDETNP